MYTQTSFQNIASIKAKAYLDLESTPVILDFVSKDYRDQFGTPTHSEIILHVENRALAAALVEAINRVVADHEAKAEQIAA